VSVVTARDLARKAGRAGDDAVDLGQFAVVVAVGGLHLVHQAVVEQALVDAAQVRDRQVAVVDPAAQQVLGAARQRVDDRRHHRVGHAGALQQGRAGALEQAAVVGRHADRVVALVDQQKHALQVAPDVVEPGGVDLAGVDAVAHPLAQRAHAVGRVARVAGRQQQAVFGVEQEQKPVQQDQRGFAHLVQVVGGVVLAGVTAVARRLLARLQIAPGQRIRQLRKDLGKHPLAQVLRHLLFVAPRLVTGVGVEAATGAVPGLRQKSGAAEEQEKQLQRMRRRGVVESALHARHAKRAGQVDLEKLLGARTRVLPIQPPDRAVAQDAPFEVAVGLHIDPTEVAQHLR